MLGNIGLFIEQNTISTYIFANQYRQAVISFLKGTVERPGNFITIPFLNSSILSWIVARQCMVMPQLQSSSSFLRTSKDNFFVTFIFECKDI